MVVFTAPLSLAGVGGHTATTKTNPTITSLIGVVAGLP